MSILNIVITKDARGYAEALTEAPFNVADALDKVTHYKLTEFARTDAVEEEVSPWDTAVTSATVLVRANCPDPEGVIRAEVGKLVSLMGGDAQAAAKAVAHGLLALEALLANSTEAFVGIYVNEKGQQTAPTGKNEEDAEMIDDIDEDYYTPTFGDMRREEYAREEAWAYSAQKLAEGGHFYDTNRPTVPQCLAIIEVVREHLEHLDKALSGPVGTVEECDMVQVFHIYNELKLIALTS